MAMHNRSVSAIAAALFVSCLPHGAALAKQSTSINATENKETFASIGDVLVKVTLRESLPNAFGGADIFGRKRDRGFVEVRFMGLANDGRAVFRRRTVDVYSNETTMSRSGMRYGSAALRAFAPMFWEEPQRLPITRPPGSSRPRANCDAASGLAPLRI